jgi:23S rRNA pseudouridine1911/1915/1917 synthase
MSERAPAPSAPPIKLSSPETQEFWEIPVLFEDEHLLAINKPARLLISPDADDASRPSLMKLLHTAIAAGKPWAKARGLTYLANAHRLDFETAGVLLLAKDKPALIKLADLFGSEKPLHTYIALVHGTPEQDEFEVDAPIGPHQSIAGLMRVEPKDGKASRTRFKCQPYTARTHQIRVHLYHVHLSVLGDALYRGGKLYLSEIKTKYRARDDKEERPLISSVALHAETLTLPHPVTGEMITITAKWPKDLEVAVKYLKMFAGL